MYNTNGNETEQSCYQFLAAGGEKRVFFLRRFPAVRKHGRRRNGETK